MALKKKTIDTQVDLKNNLLVDICGFFLGSRKIYVRLNYHATFHEHGSE